MKSYLKNAGQDSRQALSCVRSFDLLAFLGGPALLIAFIWKFPALLGDISPRRASGHSSHINENKFWQRI